MEDQSGIAANLNNIANIYRHQNNYQKALEYFQICLEMARDIDNEQRIANALNNMGVFIMPKANMSRL